MPRRGADVKWNIYKPPAARRLRSRRGARFGKMCNPDGASRTLENGDE
jgi:hypothetical protein